MEILPSGSAAFDPRSGRSGEELAQAQRFLLLSVVANIAASIAVRAGGAGIAISLAATAFVLWSVWSLCRELRITPWLWLVAMFIPLVGLICLVILNQRATKELRSLGWTIGFMGAKR